MSFFSADEGGSYIYMPYEMLKHTSLMQGFKTTSPNTVAKANWRTNHKLLFRVLLISVTVNLFSALFFIGKRIYIARSTASYKLTNSSPSDSIVTYRYNKTRADRARINLFKLQKHDSSDIVFLGTSLTEAFPLQEMFQNLTIKNRGIAGNSTNDVLLRLDEVTDGKPQKIFLEIGINDFDLGRPLPVDSVFSNFQKIMHTIKLNTPNTILYIESVLPTASTRKQIVPKIEDYNTRVSQYCQANKLTFINLYPAFYKDGGMDVSLTTDGVHLQPKGYFIWKQILEKYINE